MKPDGSRIGIVFNGSPLFTGDSGSGESEIRKWIIENDMLESVVSLPTNLFFNTSIPTYIWIVTNKKSNHRIGKVQLIDGSSFYSTLKRNLGNKNREIDSKGYTKIIETYEKFEENEFSKIFENKFFGFTKITIEQPLKKNGIIVKDKKGNLKPDSKLRDFERVPLNQDIKLYFEKEVKPHLPESWIDFDKSKVGYEINFNKYFYNFSPLRNSHEILKEIEEIESQIQLKIDQLK